MALIYKTLFEVKINHEFYLSELKGETIFQLADQQDRIDFLRNKFRQGLPAVNEELAFEVPSSLKALYSNYHLRLLNTYSGFKIAMEVNATRLNDGTTVYQPKATLPPDFAISIALTKKSADIDSYTNALLRRRIAGHYYFTNEALQGPRTFPFLTNAMNAFDAGHTYEQGELAAFAPNDVRQFFEDNVGPQWRNVTGSGFVTENDRMLVAPRFYYHLNKADNITQFKFTVENQGGDTIKTIELSKTDPIEKVLLDCSSDELQTVPGIATDPSVVYNYSATGSNGFTASGQLVFLDPALGNQPYWGLVQIKAITADAAFNLLDPLGRLITRRNPDGTRQEAPIFEIPVTSRLTYWRYINDRNGAFNIGDYPADFLDFTERALISKAPRPSTYAAVLFKKESDNTFHYLPQPAGNELLRIEDGRFYTDIIVPKSKLFPVLP